MTDILARFALAACACVGMAGFFDAVVTRLRYNRRRTRA